MRSSYSVSPGRVVLALSAAGGISFAILVGAAFAGAGGKVSLSIADFSSLAPVFFGVWALISALAGPPWLVSHRLGARSWWHALIAGAVIGILSGTVFTYINQKLIERHGMGPAPDGMMQSLYTLFAVAFGVYGALLGALCWRIAYRKDHDDARQKAVSVF